MKTTWTLCISLFVPLILAPVSTASVHDTEVRLLAHIRQATAHFHHVKTAQVVGYAQFLGCVAEPGEGAMGIHFVHSELISDTVLDPLLPEALTKRWCLSMPGAVASRPPGSQRSRR